MAIIDGLPEPKLGDKEKKQRDDDDYNKPLEVPLEETKYELKSLFGDFSNTQKDKERIISPVEIQEDIDKNTKTEEQIQEEYHNGLSDYSDTGTEEEYNEKIVNKKIKETKEYPLVKTFLEERSIVVENLSLNDEGKINIYDIDGLDIDDKEMLAGLFVNLDENNSPDNLTHFEGDLEGKEELKVLKDLNLAEGIINKIGVNYLYNLPDTANTASIAIEMTKNDIIRECKNLKQDSVSFKKAVIDIDSGNLESQFKAIERLYYLAYSSEGKKGLSDFNTFKEKRKNELKKEGIKLDYDEKEAKIKNDTILINKIEKRKKEIIIEMTELTGMKDGEKVEGGSIFEASKIDKQNEGIDKEPTN